MKTEIHNRPRLLWLGRGRYELLNDLEYSVNGEKLKVKKGFVTDFTSVPRALHWLFSKNSLQSRASIIHDNLYATGARSRKDSDIFFKNLLRNDYATCLTRILMYLAVRIFGARRYKTD